MQRLSGYPSWLYPLVLLVLGVLFASGLWLVPDMLGMRLEIEVPWGPAPAARLVGAACHSLLGFLALALVGALSGIHMRIGWRRRLNRASGVCLLLLATLLLLSAIAVLYTGNEALSLGASVVHTFAGVAGALLYLWHALSARRLRRRAR